MSLEGKTLAFFCGLGSEILCEFPVSLGQKTTRDWDIGWTKEEASSESSRLHLKIYLYPLWRPPSLWCILARECRLQILFLDIQLWKSWKASIPTKIFIEIFSETLAAADIFMLKLFQQLRKRKTVRDTTALILIKVALDCGLRVNLSFFRQILTFKLGLKSKLVNKHYWFCSSNIENNFSFSSV